MKKGILYTANKHNKNLFKWGGSWEDLANVDRLKNPLNYDFKKGAPSIVDQYKNSKNWLGISKADNPFSKGNIGGTMSDLVGGLGQAAGAAANKIITGGFNKGVKAGNAVASIGGQVGSIISKANPLVGGIISVGSGIVGGGINRAFGHQENDETTALVNANNANIRSSANALSQASSNEDILNYGSMAGGAANISDKGFKNGWLNNAGTDAKGRLDASQNAAFKALGHGLVTGAANADQINDDNTFKSFYALGGPINTETMGAIDYGFMSDYLTTKDRAIDTKNKLNNNIFGTLPSTMFALGGDLQTNGADFTTGLSRINAGGSHEENPYEGVQVGISRENGQPDLVEEGETIFDDYVYSRRIKIDKKTKDKFHISKKSDMSYADLSKKLEKEAEERPNDPISQNALSKQLHELADEQERQKDEEKAKEAQEQFAQLSPEEQTAIMQQMAMQQGQQETPMAEEAPEEAVAPMEQQIPQQQEVPMNGNVAMMQANGGNINRFSIGGDLRKKIYSLIGNIYTEDDFAKWAKENNVGDVDWENALSNEALIAALTKDNPALKHAIDHSYDFGVNTPSNTLTFDFTHGGWGKEDYDAWDGSADEAWREAKGKGLVKKGMSSDEIAKALSSTDAYQKGTTWLKASEKNRLAYLQQILNSEDAPEAAKKYASKYVDANGWIKDAAKDYDTIFGEVRTTHPGTFWKTPYEILRENNTKNFILDSDGTIKEMLTDVPSDWKPVNTYSWFDSGNNINATSNYYTRPEVATVEESAKKEGIDTTEDEVTYKPILKNENYRELGLMGPAVGLGMMAAGIGKPDYSRMDQALATINQSPALASYRPIGNYMTYKPMDIWSEQNRLNASIMATNRAIQNNNGTLGTKMAGLLANDYNGQLANAELYKKSLEYNDTLNKQVQDFNRGTDIQNANAYNQTSATNAGIINSARQQRAQMAMEDALQRMNADASWYNSLYGNVNSFFKGLGTLGKENAQHNMIANMAAAGLFGTPKGTLFKGFVQENSKGGRINRNKKK